MTDKSWQSNKYLQGITFDPTFSGSQNTCLLQAKRNNKNDNSLIDIPLKNVTHYISTKNDIMQVEVNLQYVNSYQEALLESVFNFSMSYQSCFDNFEARIGDKIIQGVIKEKVQAQKEYEEGKKQGKTMAITTIDDKLKDVIQVKMGNLEPDDNIKITLRYIQPLQSYKGEYEIKIPFTLSPRYKQKDSQKEDNYIDDCVFTNNIIYSWDIYMSLNVVNNKFKNFKCSSHIINDFISGNQIEIDGVNQPAGTLQLAQGNKLQMHLQFPKPNKDFVMRFDTVQKNNYVLQKRDVDDEPYKFCAMVSLKNDFSANNIVKKTDNPQEFIFLLDRSGSMTGNRMRMAQQCVSELLQSLPQNSYFNIVSFGSKFYTLYPIQQKATQENIENAISKIRNLNATLGGTELVAPVEHIYTKLKPIYGYARNIFMITDGNIQNQQDLFNLIKDNQEQACFYSLGIGSGCSQYLITQTAIDGNGKSEFVDNLEDLSDKMKSLLDFSLSKKFTDFQLDFDREKVKCVIPDVNQLTFLREDEQLQCFFLLEEGFEETDIQLLVNGQKAFQKKITEQEYESSDYLHKMANFKLIKKYLDNSLQKGGVYDDIFIQKQLDIERLRNEALELSVKYQVLCELTAFISEIKEVKNVDLLKLKPEEKVQIPNMISKDFEEKQTQKKRVLVEDNDHSKHGSITRGYNEIDQRIQDEMCDENEYFANDMLDDISVRNGDFQLSMACEQNNMLKRSKKHKQSCCGIDGGIQLIEISNYQKVPANLNDYQYILYSQQKQGFWKDDQKILNILGIKREEIYQLSKITGIQYYTVLLVYIFEFIQNTRYYTLCQKGIERYIWQQKMQISQLYQIKNRINDL